jgi:hypothetical protein
LVWCSCLVKKLQRVCSEGVALRNKTRFSLLSLCLFAPPSGLMSGFFLRNRSGCLGYLPFRCPSRLFIENNAARCSAPR